MNSILIRGGHVLTMDADLGDLAEADVLVREGRIIDVGPSLPARGADVVEAAGKIVAPGFVDGHRHAWQSLLHGLATDWSFPKYMRWVRGGYGGCFDTEDAYLANYLGGLEAISAGVTTVVDHSHLQTSAEVGEALLRGTWDSGVGGYFAYALQNSPDWLGHGYDDPDALNDLLTRAPDAWHDESFRNVRRTLETLDATGSGRLQLGIALPETAPYLPVDIVSPILERTRALDPAMITSHWNAAVQDGQYFSILGTLVGEGHFDGATVLAHCNQLNSDDLATMARAGIGLATTPGTESGMGLGPLMGRRLVEYGGNAALGVDTTCCTQSDLLGQARMLLEAERRDAAATVGSVPQELVWSARGALELATITGARAVGLGDVAGSLTPGKRADVVVVSPDGIRSSPGADPVATLISYTGPADIDTVLIDGEFRKRGGALTGVDTTTLARRCAHSAAAIHTRAAALPAAVIDGAWKGMF